MQLGKGYFSKKQNYDDLISTRNKCMHSIKAVGIEIGLYCHSTVIVEQTGRLWIKQANSSTMVQGPTARMPQTTHPFHTLFIYLFI